jgi:bifunctional DNA-binding transcriptional regulator/antitoxin component of YhaV-PrlF toxin-antitoxin module
MQTISCKVDNQGRVTLPLEWRRQHGVRSGSEVVLSADDCGLQIQTPGQSLHEAQQMVARHWRGRGAAVEMLREERRREAEMERKQAGGDAKGSR